MPVDARYGVVNKAIADETADTLEFVKKFVSFGDGYFSYSYRGDKEVFLKTAVALILPGFVFPAMFGLMGVVASSISLVSATIVLAKRNGPFTPEI